MRFDNSMIHFDDIVEVLWDASMVITDAATGEIAHGLEYSESQDRGVQ